MTILSRDADGKIAATGTIEARFWAKVDRSGECWNWTAQLTASGYGHFKLADGSKKRAHRLAWELERGPIPRGALVCHRCDNRKCVRVDHLFIGTTEDNMADMVRKGRSSRGDRHMSVTRPESILRGENNRAAKLTAAKVADIRREYTGRRGQLTELGKRYGVTPQAIQAIIKRQVWAL